MRALPALLPLIAPALILIASTPARGQDPRVETEVALSHLVKKVDAVAPGEAVTRKIGGPVIADVTIDTAGKVMAVTILSGPELLRPAAERALKQWIFKPFTTNGRPGPVRAILEIDFPDPIRDEERRRFEDYRTAFYQCRRQLELDASQAESACAAAIRSAELLSADHVPERGLALSDHAQALMAGGRAAEAIVEIEHALGMRDRISHGADADSADLRQILAAFHQQLGETEKADAAFAVAIEEYTAAIEELPPMRQAYESRLRIALTRYAQLKRATGDMAAASALEARAAAIATPPVSLLPLAITRSVDGIDINEPVDARLSDEDLRRVLALLTGTGKKPWRLQASASHEEPGGAVAIGDVYAFFAPDVVTPTFRRGAAAMVMRSTASWAKGAARDWAPVGDRIAYVQVATSGAGASDEPPIPVMQAAHAPMPGDQELTAIVKLVRARAVQKPTDRYLSDVQPWPIHDILVSSDEIRVALRDTAQEDHFQWVLLRKTSGQWAVAELVQIGRRPTK